MHGHNNRNPLAVVVTRSKQGIMVCNPKDTKHRIGTDDQNTIVKLNQLVTQRSPNLFRHGFCFDWGRLGVILKTLI